MVVNHKSYEQLVNNIIGQLNGVKRMLGEQAECLDVLVQLKAARSALDSLNSCQLSKAGERQKAHEPFLIALF